MVTILILVETPLQQSSAKSFVCDELGHNPYFSGNSFTTAEKFSYFKL